MKNLDGKVAIVTGAATGIGYGISKRLANDGANLVMVDLDANMMEQSASEIAARTQEVKISIGEVSEPKTAQEAVNKAIN
ncbi:MAG: SDR family NAD(P)-dependent oxidoreductase, partial [SAR202 cluster bacterium]|nr:SDR family NAD(P)-dependent oxidoreductase [SAR202 cluster bacterium]